MKNNLEDFVNAHKDEFDSYEPSEALWSRIENKLELPKKNGLVISMVARKWMSAAATVLVITAAAIFIDRSTNKQTGNLPVVLINPVKLSPSGSIPTNNDTNTINSNNQTAIVQKQQGKGATDAVKTEDPELAQNQTLESIAGQELIHYTRLVELKQVQISILKKDEPLLYKQFSTDFEDIDSEFKALKKQQTKHPDNEQLLEAMIKNLRLQSALLNRQLEIIQHINKSKKRSYEKTYNSTI